MSLLDWVGRKIKLTDAKFWSLFLGNETWAGEPVSAETAMQISSFWACVRLIARTVSTLPLGLYERQADGTRQSRSNHPLYKLVHTQPNADQTAAVFWEGMVAWLLVNGTALAPKVFRGIGSDRKLVALDRPLNPFYTTISRQDDGSLKFSYRDAKTVKDYAEDEIFILRGFGFGADLGLSPIAYARQSLSAVRATDRAAASHFANGMRPSGWLVYKGGTLEPDQRELATQNLINPMLGAENAGRIGILEGEFDYRQITIAPEDAQLLESRRHGIEEICRWHGIPPILIGHSQAGQTMWGSGIEQIVLGWYTLNLRPDLVRIEQEIGRQLLSPADRERFYAEYSIEGLLRADSAARGEFYWKLFQMGVINANWMADKENITRPPHGDRYFVNQTMAALDESGIPIKAAGALDTQPPQQDALRPAARRLEVVP